MKDINFDMNLSPQGSTYYPAKKREEIYEQIDNDLENGITSTLNTHLLTLLTINTNNKSFKK